jgi:hypothetical protein
MIDLLRSRFGSTIQKLPCDPTKHPLAHAAVAVSARDDQVGLFLLGYLHDLVGHTRRCVSAQHRRTLDPVPEKIGRYVVRSSTSGLVTNGNDKHLFGRLEQRQGIRNGAVRLARVLPGYNDPLR